MNKSDNISTEKQFLLNWIKETDNESMIKKVKNFISNLNQPQDIEIPEWQKEESARRLKEMKENPDMCHTDFKQMVDSIFSKYDV